MRNYNIRDEAFELLLDSMSHENAVEICLQHMNDEQVGELVDNEVAAYGY